jgi:Bacterial protein of unknown function (DUF885)
MKPWSRFAVSTLAFLVAGLTPPPAGAEAPVRPAWVAKSDAHAKVLVDVLARFGPEGASQFGVEGLDNEILDLKPRRQERVQQELKAALADLDKRLAAESDPTVRQDLEILVDSARDNITGNDLTYKLQVPYFDAVQVVFFGLRGLLDEQVAPERRPAALARLKRYTGLEPGYVPVLELARDRIRERLGVAGLQGPVKAAVEKNVGNSAFYVDGIAQLLQKFQVAGWEEAHARLKAQVAAYNDFLKTEVLPRSREDFRLPEEVYAYRLKQVGVDIPATQLVERARIAFMEIGNEMKTLAPLVAREKNLSVTDYRDVIRELKKQQLVGDAILPHYQARLKQMEEIIRREGIISLPERAARIRVASEAESAQTPAPNMRPPRLIGNKGEMGEFVLPLRVPTAGAAAGAMQGFDDFTFDASSWTLTAHEVRPGHELQFAALVEKGVSLARAVFAFNSVNVEGWALYAEAEMKPYMPLDGQLIGLQHRMMRAARAFLDPELQLGLIKPEQAVRLLMDEVVLSEPMARQEVEPYTFRSPGQATSYFYGYLRWMELKSRVELALGKSFDRKRYHDFLLAQGLLPPAVLTKTALAEFVPREPKGER